MEKIKRSYLTEKETQAVREFQTRILGEFAEARFILFGSKIKGGSDEFSDIDILIILEREVNTAVEGKIFDIGFDVDLKWEVVFGIIVEEAGFFNSAMAKAMPLYQNIEDAGVII